MSKKTAKAAPPADHHPRAVTQTDDGLGTRVKLLRVEAGMSQDELGKHLGVSFQQVQKYEKGINRISATRLQQIADVLNVPVAFLYGGSTKNREIESLLALDANFGMRMLKAYTSVPDATVRGRFVSLMESVAELLAAA